MSEEQFYGPEWDMANIAANTASGDAFLEGLMELADGGLGSVVGVLANGMIVVGAIATGRALAEELDSQLEVMTRSVERPSDMSVEEWDERRELWIRRNTRAYEEAEKERASTEAEVEAEGDPTFGYDIKPQGLARKALDSHIRTMLTLVDVQIIAPAQHGRVKLPVLRLAVQQIAAWWPISVDEEGKASFQLFDTEGE